MTMQVHFRGVLKSSGTAHPEFQGTMKDIPAEIVFFDMHSECPQNALKAATDAVRSQV
jgi:hypothetical protein